MPYETDHRQRHESFVGPAYHYIRASDQLPTLEELGQRAPGGGVDPVMRVKLFLPAGRFTYYVAAATEYEEDEPPILTGYCISAAGPDCDAWGDTALGELMPLRVMGLPLERDIFFKPTLFSAVRTGHP